MRPRPFAPLALAISLLASACADDVTAPTPAADAPAVASPYISGSFQRIVITTPSTSYYSMGVGGVKQMYGRLYYTSGSISSSPYASWSSVDPCVAKVSSVSPTWGKVTGIKSGTVYIIASAWGKADTVKVTVTGTGNLDSGCYTRWWTWNYNDASFTATPATSYSVKSGEVLKKLVTFAPKSSIKVGYTYNLLTEMWYSGGGKLKGEPYVTYTTQNGLIATIDAKTGVVRGRAVGKTKAIAKLGSMSDTVPIIIQ
jgi:hypothetical protein